MNRFGIGPDTVDDLRGSQSIRQLASDQSKDPPHPWLLSSLPPLFTSSCANTSVSSAIVDVQRFLIIYGPLSILNDWKACGWGASTCAGHTRREPRRRMGIPKFYRWLSERYPLINQVAQSRCDHILLPKDYWSWMLSVRSSRALWGLSSTTSTLVRLFCWFFANRCISTIADMNGIIHMCSHPRDGES